jgi:hypothetical protein
MYATENKMSGIMIVETGEWWKEIFAHVKEQIT